MLAFKTRRLFSSQARKVSFTPKMLIDGKLKASESNKFFATINPSNEEELANIP